ncbi:hypothetical protein EDD11_010123, partial [Mortierella claussenii]
MAKNPRAVEVEEEGLLGAVAVSSNQSTESTSVEDSRMEVDEEDVEDTSPMTLEGARECLKEQGEMLQKKIAERAMQARRSMKSASKMTPEKKAALETLKEEIKDIDERIVEWTEIVGGLERARDAACRPETRSTVIKSMSGALVATSVKSPDESEVKLTADIPRYHRMMEPSLMPTTDPKSSGPIINNVRIFLHEFRNICQLKYGVAGFQRIAFRLLSLANLDRKAADAFVVAREGDPGSEWDWQRCEQEFVDAALTPLEKALEVDEFAKAGREGGESYKELHHRLKRLVEVYRVKELPKHADVTQTLRMTIPSLTLTVMQIAEVQKRILAHIGLAMPDVTTLDFLMDSIPHVHGPDDCTEWKTVIDDLRRRREDVKKPKQGMSTAPTMHSSGGNRAAAPTQSYSYYQPTRNNYRGRGGYRGGYSNPHRGAYRSTAPYNRHHGEWNEHEEEMDAMVEENEEVINHNMVSVQKEDSTCKAPSPQEETPFEEAEKEKREEDEIGEASSAEDDKEKVEETIVVSAEIEKKEVEETAEEIKTEKKPATATKKKKKRKLKKRVLTNGGVRVITRADIVTNMIAVLEERENKSAVKGNESDGAATEERVKFAAAKVMEDNTDMPEDDAYDKEHASYTIEHDMVTSQIVSPFESRGGILHFNASKNAGKKDNRIFIHVTIRQERHLALIDTGATHSFISKTVVDQYRIPVSPQKGLIELADRSTIPRLGETESVEVTCGDNMLSAPYEVIDQEHAITIGMDLFHRFGFNLMGIPDPEMTTEKASPPVEDAKPTLIPLKKPLIEETSEFVKEKQEFMRQIKDALEKNKQISPQSHCPIPEMK